MAVTPAGLVIDSALKSVGVKNVAKTKAIVIGGATLLLVGAITVFIIRRRKRKRAADFGIEDMEDELGQIQIGSSRTISDGNAILISQNLLAAMNKYGTDEDAIYSALEQCKTKDDLLLVIKKFGSKNYNGAGLATSWLDKNYLSTMKNLSGWLRAELTKRELAKVKEIYDKLGVPL